MAESNGGEARSRGNEVRQPTSTGPQADRRAAHRRVTIVTGIRLHFGLLRTSAPFGGAGVMLENPNGVIHVSENDRFECDSTYQDRIEPIVDRMQRHFGWTQRPRLRIQVPIPFQAHVGQGSGTQLSMGIVQGICELVGEPFKPLEMGPSLADRGKRSAVGVHGYATGGMIIEDVGCPNTRMRDTDADFERGSRLNPVAERIELPQQWEAAFFVPPGVSDAPSGKSEQQRFDRLDAESDQKTQTLRKILMNELAPAAHRHDFDEFTSALTRYNHESGMLFESVQGGPYNGSAIADFVSHLQSLGAVGVGQSSWGPGVFCWFRSHDDAVGFAKATIGNVPNFRTARPKNTPAEVFRDA